MVSWLFDPAAWVRWWSHVYADSTLLSTTIVYLHLAGLVVGGGAAIATDRQILGAWRRPDALRFESLEAAASVHALVVGGLAFMVATGVLMTAADWDTFRASPLFWGKMLGVALLVLNGGALTWAERTARQTGGRRGWPLLAASSAMSVVLWLGLLGLGTWLRASA